MFTVIGVRFKKAGKIYYFDPGEFDLQVGDAVIVETARGVVYGDVVIGKRSVNEKDVVLPLKKVLRVADQQDLQQVLDNSAASKEAFYVCQSKIREHDLSMKLVDVEYTY